VQQVLHPASFLEQVKRCCCLNGDAPPEALGKGIFCCMVEIGQWEGSLAWDADVLSIGGGVPLAGQAQMGVKQVQQVRQGKEQSSHKVLFGVMVLKVRKNEPVPDTLFMRARKAAPPVKKTSAMQCKTDASKQNEKPTLNKSFFINSIFEKKVVRISVNLIPTCVLALFFDKLILEKHLWSLF
jgi:hypothetical protein